MCVYIKECPFWKMKTQCTTENWYSAHDIQLYNSDIQPILICWKPIFLLWWSKLDHMAILKVSEHKKLQYIGNFGTSILAKNLYWDTNTKFNRGRSRGGQKGHLTYLKIAKQLINITYSPVLLCAAISVINNFSLYVSFSMWAFCHLLSGK